MVVDESTSFVFSFFVSKGGKGVVRFRTSKMEFCKFLDKYEGVEGRCPDQVR